MAQCTLIKLSTDNARFDYETTTQVAEQAGIKFIWLRSKEGRFKAAPIRGFQGCNLVMREDSAGRPRFQYTYTKDKYSNKDISANRHAEFYLNPIDHFMYSAIPDTPFNRVRLMATFCLGATWVIVDEKISEEIESMHRALATQEEIERTKIDEIERLSKQLENGREEIESLRRQVEAAKSEASKAKELLMSVPTVPKVNQNIIPVQLESAPVTNETNEERMINEFTKNKNALDLINPSFVGMERIKSGEDMFLLKKCRKIARKLYLEIRESVFTENAQFIEDQKSKYKILAHSSEYCAKIPNEIDKRYLETIKDVLTKELIK